MPETTVFNHDHPIYKELDRLGYIPPKCIAVSIDLRAWERPLIHVTASAGEELSRFVQDLRDAKVSVEVVGGREKGRIHDH